MSGGLRTSSHLSPGQAGGALHLAARTLLSALIVLLAATAAAQPGIGGLSVEAQDGAPSAEKMTALAERLGGVDAEAAQAGADGTPKVAQAPIESTPLGQAAPRRALGLAGNTGDDETPRGFGMGSGLLTTLTALGVVVGLIFLVRWGVARLSGTPIAAANPAVEVLSRSSVAPRSHVLLLRVGPRVLVVGESSTGLRTLSEVADEQEVATLLQAVESARPQSVAGGFNTLLSRFNRPYDEADGDPESTGMDTGEAQVDRARDSLSALAARLRLRSGKGGAA